MIAVGLRHARRAGLSFPALMVLIYLIVFLIGAVIGLIWFPPGLQGKPHDVAGALVKWDAAWYLAIAEFGYRWLPNHTTLQWNVAFFPLFPLIEVGIERLLGVWMPLVYVALSFVLGVASIFAFHRLARDMLPETSARIATAGFALYPGAVFILDAYPVSLMNLLCILTLLALRRNKKWSAAVMMGVASAAGPLALVAAVVVPLHVIDARLGEQVRGAWRRLSAWLNTGSMAILTGLVSISGFIGFVLYQWWRFGTPTAFVSAQQGWGTASLALRLVRAATFFPLTAYSGFSGVGAGGTHPGVQFELYIQSVEGAVAMAVCFMLLASQIRLTRWPVTVAGFAVLLAYYWGAGTVYGPMQAWRNLYVVIPMFLGIGVIANHTRWGALALVGFFTLLLGSQVALSVAGYTVI